MKHVYLALIIVTSILVGWGLNDSYRQFQAKLEYTCSFLRMESTFEATHSEVYGDSTLITVHIGDRTFMFPRANLTACFKVRPEDYELTQ